MYTDGTRRTSQFSCYESTVVNFVGGGPYQSLLLSRLATPPMSMGFISKQDNKMVHKRALYAFLFQFTSNERAIFQTIRQLRKPPIFFIQELTRVLAVRTLARPITCWLANPFL